MESDPMSALWQQLSETHRGIKKSDLNEYIMTTAARKLLEKAPLVMINS